ncbi:MAG: hypothetical protein C0484_16760 [Rhodospirillum sp.]|nr:hypothetical protein [Rhodospirillum sp.]
MTDIHAELAESGITILDGERKVGTYPADTKFAFDGATLVAFRPDLSIWFVDIVTGRIRLLEDEEERRFALSMWRTAPLRSRG